MSKQTGGATTHYQYDESGRIIGENNGSTGANIREYIYLNNQPLAQIESGGSIYYIHNDHLGTPQKMTDATPAIVWDRVQQPFGETWSVTGSVVNNFRFPGQYYDAESGLNQNMMRDYQSGTGRYIQSDPLGLLGTSTPNMNLYGYANQNPVRYIDPIGEQVVLPNPGLCINPLLCGILATAALICTAYIAISGPDPLPLPKNITCLAKCNVQQIDRNATCPERVFGTATGSNQANACVAAQRDANKTVPRGCYKRHCQCDCS